MRRCKTLYRELENNLLQKTNDIFKAVCYVRGGLMLRNEYIKLKSYCAEDYFKMQMAYYTGFCVFINNNLLWAKHLKQPGMNCKEYFRKKVMQKNATEVMCFELFSHFALQVTLKHIWCAFKMKITEISLYENV